VSLPRTHWRRQELVTGCGVVTSNVRSVPLAEREQVTCRVCQAALARYDRISARGAKRA